MAENYGIPATGISSTSDPFEDASSFTNVTSNFVTDQIELIRDVAVGPLGDTGVLQKAETAISNLSMLSDVIATLPAYDVSNPILDPVLNATFDVPDIDTTVFGTVSDFSVDNTIDTDLTTLISEVTIPGFEPTPFSIVIPDAPIPANIIEPGAVPASPGFSFPAAPVITLPDAPQLTTVVIPEFTSPVLPDFDPTFPAFLERNISTMIDWQEPVYTEEVIDEVKTQISVFFSGGSGIDPDIEESIWARGRDREDRAVRQQEQQATNEFATRGFTTPPGMLVKRLDNIREEGVLKKLSLNREAAIKVHQDEIDNLRFAVQQGIAAEEIYVRMFLAKVERLFEVQKLNIQWQIDLYNIYVQAFAAQMEEVKIRAQVYEVQVQAALIEIEIFKALIEGEKVKAEINKVLIEAYVAVIGAREALVRMYSEQVKAVGIQADVFSTEVQAYGHEVGAFAARVGADKNRFDAYAAQIKGEGSKADILASEARAYQSEVQGIETGVRAEVAALEGEVSAIEVQIRNFEAIVRGQIGRAQVQLGGIQANVAGNSTNTERFVAKTGAEEAATRVEVAAWEGGNRTNLEIFKADIASFQARLERAVKEIDLRIASESSAGDLASTITAGALAAMHVGASVSGSGSVGSSGNLSFTNAASQGVTCTTNNSSSINYTATQLTSHDCPQILDSGSSTISGGFT